jgi:hypothetical protein
LMRCPEGRRSVEVVERPKTDGNFYYRPATPRDTARQPLRIKSYIFIGR